MHEIKYAMEWHPPNGGTSLGKLDSRIQGYLKETCSLQRTVVVVDNQEEVRELREVVTSLQWALVETLKCCELVGQDAAVDEDVLKRIEKAGRAVMHLKPSPPLNESSN